MFLDFGLLLGGKLENSIDFFMLRLPGLQDMIDNPQPIMRKKPCNQELLDHVKTVSFKKEKANKRTTRVPCIIRHFFHRV